MRRQVLKLRSKGREQSRPRQHKIRRQAQPDDADYLVLYALVFKFLKMEDYQRVFERRYEAEGINTFLEAILEEYSGCKQLAQIPDQRIREAVLAQIEALQAVQLLNRARPIQCAEGENLEQRILTAGEEAERSEGSSLKLISRVKKILDTMEKEEIQEKRSSLIGEALSSHDVGDHQKRNRDLKRLQEIDLAKLARRNTEESSHSNN